MQVDTLVIVPSRQRPHNVERLIRSWRQTTNGSSELLICLDDDDNHNYKIPDDVSLLVRPRMRLGAWWNYASTQYNNGYIKYVGFLGDDNTFNTNNWEEYITKPLRNNVGISYGNDLCHGESLCTSAFLSVEIIKALGYAAPPGLIHLFIDNFWQALGYGIKSIHYVPEVIIEHLHHTLGKSQFDRIYQDVNSVKMWEHDRSVWEEYCRSQLPRDIKRVNNYHAQTKVKI